jgi:hypothetical protein
MKVRSSRGFSINFPRKIKKLDFLELFLDRKIHGLGPQGCGPRWPSPLRTGGHCHVPELIGARPPAAPLTGVAGRGAEEGKGSTRVERRWSNDASVMKAVAGRASVRVTRGSEMGQGGVGEKRWEEGMPGALLYGRWGRGAAEHRRGTGGDGGAP